MAHATATAPRRFQSVRTGVLLVALGLAVALGSWRATSILTAPGAAAHTGTQVEQRLTGLLATLVGPGAVQVHIAPRPNGSRAILVLIDDSAADVTYDDGAITSLLGAAYHIDALRGDTVAIERAVFAAGVTASSQAQLVELGAYILLCGLVGFALVAREAPPETLRHGASAPAPAPRPAPVPNASGLPTPSNDIVARRMGEDPRQAAETIRSWLRGHETPS